MSRTPGLSQVTSIARTPPARIARAVSIARAASVRRRMATTRVSSRAGGTAGRVRSPVAVMVSSLSLGGQSLPRRPVGARREGGMSRLGAGGARAVPASPAVMWAQCATAVRLRDGVGPATICYGPLSLAHSKIRIYTLISEFGVCTLLWTVDDGATRCAGDSQGADPRRGRAVGGAQRLGGDDLRGD